jgi:hypothetical protein
VRVTVLARALVAAALLAAASPALAGSVTAAQIAALCGNAEDTPHCGRMIEEQQLKRFAGIASRDGDELRVTLYPRGDVLFRDVVRPTAVESYTLWDVLADINGVLLFVNQGDRASYLLLMRNNGRQFRLPAEPAVSPDRAYVVTADFCASGCDNEVALWRLTRDDVRKERVLRADGPWTDVTAAWSGSDEVVVDYTQEGETDRRELRLARNDARWRPPR